MSMDDFVADYIFAHRDDILGHCETCENNGEGVSCPECKHGSRFELDASGIARRIMDEAVAFAKAHCGLCVSCEFLRYCKNANRQEFIKQPVTCYACGTSGKYFSPSSSYEKMVRSAVANELGASPQVDRP